MRRASGPWSAASERTRRPGCCCAACILASAHAEAGQEGPLNSRPPRSSTTCGCSEAICQTLTTPWPQAGQGGRLRTCLDARVRLPGRYMVGTGVSGEHSVGGRRSCRPCSGQDSTAGESSVSVVWCGRVQHPKNRTKTKRKETRGSWPVTRVTGARVRHSASVAVTVSVVSTVAGALVANRVPVAGEVDAFGAGCSCPQADRARPQAGGCRG